MTWTKNGRLMTLKWRVIYTILQICFYYKNLNKLAGGRLPGSWKFLVRRHHRCLLLAEERHLHMTAWNMYITVYILQSLQTAGFLSNVPSFLKIQISSRQCILDWTCVVNFACFVGHVAFASLATLCPHFSASSRKSLDLTFEFGISLTIT